MRNVKAPIMWGFALFKTDARWLCVSLFHLCPVLMSSEHSEWRKQVESKNYRSYSSNISLGKIWQPRPCKISLIYLSDILIAVRRFLLIQPQHNKEAYKLTPFSLCSLLVRQGTIPADRYRAICPLSVNYGAGCSADRSVNRAHKPIPLHYSHANW